MERQAGLGRSLGDVLDSLNPVEPADSAPRHVLFGIGSDEPSTNTEKKKKKKKKNTKKSGKKSGKSSVEQPDQKKKKKKKKKKNKSKS